MLGTPGSAAVSDYVPPPRTVPAFDTPVPSLGAFRRRSAVTAVQRITSGRRLAIFCHLFQKTWLDGSVTPAAQASFKSRRSSKQEATLELSVQLGEHHLSWRNLPSCSYGIGDCSISKYRPAADNT
ncbi:hypothetical protein PsYK624_153500 [Phanerochaete sordida]|uniref:Uncharacterized protein n=1 Tax=Phanerochaete sordida TaxID=48140 RepID=A0A9P3GRN1_9APHY|nr:hypothetical protein PsYK624_153500 [Phanerochaete sordida]